MSVVYGRWEVASGPSIGYNVSIQGNICASAEALASETANYSANTLLTHESFMKVVAPPDTSKGLTCPNSRALTPQDTVVRGLSSLSLHTQLQPHQARSPYADLSASPSCESSSKSLDLKCNTLLARDERNFCYFDVRLTGCQRIISGPAKTTSHQSRSGVNRVEDVCNVGSVLSPWSCSSDGQGFTTLNSLSRATRGSLRHRENCDSHKFLHVPHNPKYKLEVVVEDKPFEETFTGTMKDDLDDDTLSSSSNSVSALHDNSVDGSVSSGGVYGGGDSEVQSVYNGPSSRRAYNGGSPPRKGLSRFYAGKSRSFSCLADAMLVGDLAKPENPYARKRRCYASRILNDDRTQLPPLQKGAASISKKALHNGKATLALAVAMSTRKVVIDEEKDDQSLKRDQRSMQSSPITSRSRSLSDLQRVTKSQVLIET